MSEFRVTSSQLNRGSQELLDLNGQQFQHSKITKAVLTVCGMAKPMMHSTLIL